ncbi:hypothetical protein ACQR11_03155 [Bradyrhizobium oligotrophicum]
MARRTLAANADSRKRLSFRQQEALAAIRDGFMEATLRHEYSFSHGARELTQAVMELHEKGLVAFDHDEGGHVVLKTISG